MIKLRIYPWIVIGLCCLIMLALAAVSPATGQSLPPPPTAQPTISPLAQEVALKTGLEISLVNEMLTGGVPADEINQEAANEWPAHVAALAERQQRRSQIQAVSGLDIQTIEATSRDLSIPSLTADELHWQQIETAHALGDIQTQLTLAGQLPASPERQILLETLSGKQISAPESPQATDFIGRNGNPCAYDDWSTALAAAVNGDTLYVDQGTWVGRIGQVTKNLTIRAASNNCQTPAVGGVTIDADDAAATYGGVVDIINSAHITFTNLILTDGTASFGGILYADFSTQVVLDNTDLTYGAASTYGGCLRVNNSNVTMLNDSEITDCATTGSGDGGGVAINGGQLVLYDASRIGDYLDGNTAAASGGGVYMDGGELSLYDTSRIRSNIATDYGGGVFASDGATVNLHDESDIGYIFTTANNSAVNGAGVYLAGIGDSLNMEDNSTLQYNTAGGNGGGVYMDAGSHLSMNSASILKNEAVSRGGGIYTDGGVTVEVANDSQISENETTDSLGTGGGLYAWGNNAYITVTNSSIMTNTAAYYGGIRLFSNTGGGAQLTLESDSNLSYNEAITGDGGAIAIYSGILTIDNSRVEYNTAVLNGGAIHVNGNGTLNVVDSRIERNEAGQNGGGIYNTQGEINITCQHDIGTVDHNTATNSNGGGIYDSTGNTLSIQATGSGACYVGSNISGQNGGGIYMVNDTFLDSTGAVIYVNNTAHDHGGAIYMTSGSDADFNDTDARNSVSAMYNNRAMTGNGGAIYAAGNSHVLMLGARIGVIVGNKAYMGDGGGIYIENSTLDLFNTKVLNNQALLNGGGIAAYTSTVTMGSVYSTPLASRLTAPEAPQVSPCIPGDLPANRYCSEINNNQVEGDGGGLYLYNSTSTVANTAILTNTADIGAAVRIYFGSLELKNSLISANDSVNSLNPAIIHVYAGVSPLDTAVLTATHNTIADNLGTGIYYASNTDGEFHNNILWGNDTRGSLTLFTNASCNDTQGSAFSGTGNISGDPVFITTPRGPYRLSYNSPAVNRCTTNGLVNDLDGVVRPWGSAYDMGAFEAIMNFLPVVIR